jgi:hypothetical protein
MYGGCITTGAWARPVTLLLLKSVVEIRWKPVAGAAMSACVSLFHSAAGPCCHSQVVVFLAVVCRCVAPDTAAEEGPFSACWHCCRDDLLLCATALWASVGLCP